MKLIVVLIAAGLATFGAQGAVADPATAESTVTDAARIITKTRYAQQTLCQKPRTFTPERCNADYEAFIPKLAEFSARQILFLLAEQEGRDKTKVERLRQETEKIKNETLSLSRDLDKHYVPLQTVGAVQQ